jgi:hypothetical protein
MCFLSIHIVDSFLFLFLFCGVSKKKENVACCCLSHLCGLYTKKMLGKRPVGDDDCLYVRDYTKIYEIYEVIRMRRRSAEEENHTEWLAESVRPKAMNFRNKILETWKYCRDNVLAQDAGLELLEQAAQKDLDDYAAWVKGRTLEEAEKLRQWCPAALFDGSKLGDGGLDGDEAARLRAGLAAEELDLTAKIEVLREERLSVRGAHEAAGKLREYRIFTEFIETRSVAGKAD